jgi:chromosome segregation ATPase
MEIKTITDLITSLGFPIACVIAMGAFIWNLYKKSIDREDKLMAEIAANRVINGQAIETIAKYAERLDVIQKDISDIKTDITVIKSKEN